MVEQGAGRSSRDYQSMSDEELWALARARGVDIEDGTSREQVVSVLAVQESSGAGGETGPTPTGGGAGYRGLAGGERGGVERA